MLLLKKRISLCVNSIVHSFENIPCKLSEQMVSEDRGNISSEIKKEFFKE